MFAGCLLLHNYPVTSADHILHLSPNHDKLGGILCYRLTIIRQNLTKTEQKVSKLSEELWKRERERDTR